MKFNLIFEGRKSLYLSQEKGERAELDSSPKRGSEALKGVTLYG